MRIALHVESEDYRWMADAAVASAKTCMPDVPVVHLTNMDMPPLAGADAVLRDPGEGRSFLGRYFGQAHKIDDDLLLVNCDVLFASDVRCAFAKPFNVAAPHIASRSVRYDGAAIYTRRGVGLEFWHALQATASCRGADAPLAAQLADINWALKQHRAADLSGHEFSYVPRTADDPCNEARMVHYRGPRKHWMAQRLGYTGAVKQYEHFR